MSLPEGFRLETASEKDLQEAFLVMQEAWAGEEVWQALIKDCDLEEVHPWVVKTFVPRWAMPDITTYKIVEESSGRIAAWAALQFPWKYIPAMTDEMKAIATSEEVPPVLPGTNMEALIALYEMMGGANKYDYNPQVDYHRKGTMVHPEFQKKGLGTALTVAWNKATDKSGDRTWCPARPTSVKMFRDHGFKDIGTVDARGERFGGSRENSITYILVREPHGSGQAD